MRQYVPTEQFREGKWKSSWRLSYLIKPKKLVMIKKRTIEASGAARPEEVASDSKYSDCNADGGHAEPTD